MKVLILTQPIGLNYGGILQAFALQYFLKQNNIMAVTLDWDIEHSVMRKYLNFFKRLIKKMFINHNIKVFYNGLDHHSLDIVTYYTRDFIKRKIEMSEAKICVNSSLDGYLKLFEYDAYIAGSDQCWACSTPSRYVKNCMFDFLKNKQGKIRIAYAASFGKDSFCTDVRFVEECASLMRNFDGISVREDSGVNICKKLFGVESVQVLDPTMLLDIDCYKKLSYERNDFKNEGNLFYYVLDESLEKQSIIDKVTKQMQLQSFRVLPKYKYEEVGPKHIEDCILPPVEQWLRAFVDARYVVTDSFHGTVFSILFKRPFIAIGNSSRGMTRFTSLLRLFGLEDRLVLKPKDVTPELINKPIDYKRVYAILEAERKKSKKFLMDALNIKK